MNRQIERRDRQKTIYRLIIKKQLNIIRFASKKFKVNLIKL